MRPDTAALPPRYLRTKEAAEFLSLSARTLEKHRTYGTGPAYRKLGGRVVYSVGDLESWARAAPSPRPPIRAAPSFRQSAILHRPAESPADTHADRIRSLHGGAASIPFGALDSSICFERAPVTSRHETRRISWPTPFSPLSKSHRVALIDFSSGDVTIRVEAVPDHGMATIWDAEHPDLGREPDRRGARTPDYAPRA